MIPTLPGRDLAPPLPLSPPAEGDHHPPEAEEEHRQDQAVVAADPLRRYLAVIRHYPLLSPDEEYQLAVRYKEQGDTDAAYRLVTGNLRLVVKIASSISAPVTRCSS